MAEKTRHPKMPLRGLRLGVRRFLASTDESEYADRKQKRDGMICQIAHHIRRIRKQQQDHRKHDDESKNQDIERVHVSFLSPFSRGQWRQTVPSMWTVYGVAAGGRYEIVPPQNGYMPPFKPV